MEITGTQTIAAPRQRVWDALNDPETLKKSLPGCELVERTAVDEFKVIMAAAIGPLRARFNGQLRMNDVRAPESCTMVFEGQGGAVGFGKGNSSVKLTEADGGTQITYTANAQVGGKLAQVGSRMIDSVARKMADDFFKAFKGQLAGDSAAGPELKPPAGPNAVGARVKSPQAAADPATAPRPSGQVGERVAAEVGATCAGARESSSVMVPGWWLAVAAIIGSAATVVGTLLAR